MLDTRAHTKGRKERLQRLISDIRDQTFPYQARPDKPRDWARYDEAQAHELADILDLTHRLIETLPEPTPPTGPGRHPTYPAKDLAKTILLQSFFQTSNRVTAGYTRAFREKLRLERPIHYKAIERAYGSPRVVGLLLMAFASTARLGVPSTEGYTLDGSGVPTSIKGNWERDKSQDKAMAERFDGAITMVALPSQLIAAYVPRRIGFTSEVDQLPVLVHKTVSVTGSLVGIVSADAGFQSRDNCRVISEAGGVPRIMPRRNVSLRTRGVPSWTRMLGDLLRDPQAWLEEYHERSLAETSWSVYVWLFPRPLRRRVPVRRASEHLGRFVVFNLVRLSRGYRLGLLPQARALFMVGLN